MLWNAVSEAVAPIAHLEKEHDTNKLEKKIRDYFSKGVKGLEFHSKDWATLINDYADKVFSSLFCGLGDREWLNQADFLMCVDAGVKEYFPAHVLASVPQQAFEQAVLAAADRAYDEQRFWTFRWETVQRCCQGKLTQKKVREALDTGRAEAYQLAIGLPEGGQAQQFLTTFIVRTLEEFMKAVGDVNNLPCDAAVELFSQLIDEGAFPLWLTQSEGTPTREDGVVAQLVQDFYAQNGAASGGCAMKGKGKGKMVMGKGYGGPPAFGDLGMPQGFGGMDFGGPMEPSAKRWKGGW